MACVLCIVMIFEIISIVMAVLILVWAGADPNVALKAAFPWCVALSPGRLF